MKFRDEYWFLSNMYPCPVPVIINGKERVFPCAETAFQAMKCPDQADRFIGLDGFAAKRIGRKVPLRSDWNHVRVHIMRTVIRSKFMTNPDLLKKLKMVRDEIVEDNTWNDTFWGRCNGVGENRLGQILMELRDFYGSRNFNMENTYG